MAGSVVGRVDGRNCLQLVVEELSGAATDRRFVDGCSDPTTGRPLVSDAIRLPRVPVEVGAADVFDRAMVTFAEAYADQNDRDYAAFTEAVQAGRIPASARADR